MLSAARSSEELVCLLRAGEKGVTGLQQRELSPQACISDTSCEVSNPRVTGSAMLLSISWQDRKLLLKGIRVHLPA